MRRRRDRCSEPTYWIVGSMMKALPRNRLMTSNRICRRSSPTHWPRAAARPGAAPTVEIMLPEQKNRVPITQRPRPLSAPALKPAPLISGQNRNPIPATPKTPAEATRARPSDGKSRFQAKIEDRREREDHRQQAGRHGQATVIEQMKLNENRQQPTPMKRR